MENTIKAASTEDLRIYSATQLPPDHKGKHLIVISTKEGKVVTFFNRESKTWLGMLYQKHNLSDELRGQELSHVTQLQASDPSNDSPGVTSAAETIRRRHLSSSTNANPPKTDGAGGFSNKKTN